MMRVEKRKTKKIQMNGFQVSLDSLNILVRVQFYFLFSLKNLHHVGWDKNKSIRFYLKPLNVLCLKIDVIVI